MKWELDKRSRPYTNLTIIFLVMGVLIIAIAFFMRYSINEKYLSEQAKARYCLAHPELTTLTDGTDCTAIRGKKGDEVIEKNVLTEIQELKRCCYPTECPQSKENPENCTCLYTIKCEGVNT